MAYTPTVLFSNNAATTLAAALTIGGSSLNVTTGTGALFPTISGSQYFYVTLEDASDASVFEIVKVTARSSDTFTITRAQDGTAAQAWAASDKVQLRLPSIAIEDLETQLSGYADTVSAATVSDTVYGAGWNGVTTIAPSKNAVYDKIETLVAGSVSDTAYGVGWDGETAVAPSKNAVYDKIETIVSGSVSDTAYAGSWNGVTSIAPSKNAVYDEIELRATKASPTFTGTVTTDVLAVGGATTLTGALAANGGVTLGDGSGDALTINSSAVTCANGINFDSNTLVIDSTNNRVGVGTASPGTPLDVTGVARATSFTLLSGGGGQITFQDGTTMNSAGLGSASALSATGNADITGDSDNNGVGNINFISGATTVATITPDNETTFNYGVYGKGAGLGHHVDAYGASAGGAAGSNVTAIDLAIAAALANTNGSNTVIFGPGTYSIDSVINIPMTTSTAKGINIIGAGSYGAGATIISLAAAQTGFNFSSDAASDDGGSTSYGSFTLKDIAFTGGAISVQIGTTTKTLHPRSKFILENVFGTLFTSIGLKIYNTLEGECRNVVMRGVEGNSAGDASLYIDAETGHHCGDIAFYNCEFSGNASGAEVNDYAVYATTSGTGVLGGLRFTDTNFYHGGLACVCFAGSTGMIQDVTFLNCAFDYPTAPDTEGNNYAILIDNDSTGSVEDTSVWKDFRFIGNYFQSYATALYIPASTVSATNMLVKQLVFSDNYVANCLTSAIAVVQTEGCVFSNNTFRHCGHASLTSYIFNFAGTNQNFVCSNNVHVANRTGSGGSQVPQDSNLDSMIAVVSGCNYFTISGNVCQVRNSSTLFITDLAGSVEKSVYGNIAYKSSGGSFSGTTTANLFDGSITASDSINAGNGFTGSGAGITALNASNISSGTMAVSYLGIGGIYPANSGANITNVDAITLLGNTWAIPEAIGATTPNTGKFTTLNATTTSSGLRVGIDSATIISEGHIAAFGVSGGSGLTIGWNKGSAATPVVESGATAYVNYSGAGTGGHQFFNFTGTISAWTSTTPQLLGGWASDGALYTVRSGGTKYNWHLMGYTTTAPSATGYVGVYIDGVLYKLLAST